MMRLARLHHGHGPLQQLLLWLLRICFRCPVPDVARATLYRPELFGRPFNAWIQSVLRGPSGWSVGERELFAALISQLNRCQF